jgi:hypothetical protein
MEMAVAAAAAGAGLWGHVAHGDRIGLVMPNLPPFRLA